jgi:hypothetical protein
MDLLANGKRPEGKRDMLEKMTTAGGAIQVRIFATFIQPVPSE